MPYPVLNTLLDDGFPQGALNYWLSSFTNGLIDALIDTAVERYRAVPSPMTADALRALPRRRHAHRATATASRTASPAGTC